MLQDNQVIQIQQMNAESFFSMFESIIDRKLSGFIPTAHTPQASQSERYQTQKEARIFLGNVSDVTMWQYRKKGILKAHRLGCMLRYKESELIEAFGKINAKK